MKMICALAIATTLAAVSAAGQSMVDSSNIEAGDVLDMAPTAFEIVFAHDAILERVVLETSLGELLEIAYAAPETSRAGFSVPLPELPDGDYVLSWRASGMGDHVMSGSVDFTVAGDGSDPSR